MDEIQFKLIRFSRSPHLVAFDFPGPEVLSMYLGLLVTRSILYTHPRRSNTYIQIFSFIAFEAGAAMELE